VKRIWDFQGLTDEELFALLPERVQQDMAHSTDWKASVGYEYLERAAEIEIMRREWDDEERSEREGQEPARAEPETVHRHRDMPIVRRVGQAARIARALAGHTLETLSKGTGISPAHLSRIERGRQPIRIDHLAAIAKVVGLSVAELVVAADDHGCPRCDNDLASHIYVCPDSDLAAPIFAIGRTRTIRRKAYASF